MKVLRFTGLLAWRIVSPFAAAFLLVPLAIAWVLLGIVVFVMTAWSEA